MRRKISLYIADQLVDLDDQSIILFNYTMEDLSNPTIVKNSYSQQLTLKGTPGNNRIFGASFKLDRAIANTGGNAGVDYNASKKTPFTIYNEMNEILESGYVKLDSVTRVGADVQYNVTLYGGLGSFFYALSYDENGNKRTLADMDYLGTDNPVKELDFAITKESVQDAWDRLYDDPPASIETLWDVINFAPAYNGIPEGNFSPDKALVVPSSVGLQDFISGYGLKSGYSLVTLAEAQDEWAVKDLRSYLQRPVFSLKAFWEAVCNPANNGGYEVDASIIQDYTQFPYTNLWMTLPLLSSIGSIKQTTGGLTLTRSSSFTSLQDIATATVNGTISPGSMVDAAIYAQLDVQANSDADKLNLFRTYFDSANRLNAINAVMFLQMVAYASDDTIIGGSPVKCIGQMMSSYSPAAIAEAVGYVAPYANGDDTYEQMVTGGSFESAGGGVFSFSKELAFNVSVPDVAYYKLNVTGYNIHERRTAQWDFKIISISGGSSSLVTLYDLTLQADVATTSTRALPGTISDSLVYSTPESLRSGAVITKSMLLSSTNTPADYMLSFCKMFGLHFHYDNATRKITILRRNDLYQDETIDLTKMVDLSKGITLQPLAFDAKWYDFILEGVGGAFFDEYINVEGVEYGSQRVNTGYDFDADSTNLMDSVVFKNAVTILDRSKYYNIIHNGQTFIPSPFLDKGNKYTLWDVYGETLETDISCPPTSASVEYYNENEDFAGYDINFARKLELRDKDNKPIDGDGVLVYLEGWNHYDFFKLTDDIPAMDILNDGVPCWLLGAGGADEDALRIPIFGRYRYGNGYRVEESLDFGMPRQLDIPGITYDETCTLYNKGWRNYLADRYNSNTKVMTCQVNFAGMQVNQDLLRKFYWYGNSLWVLNKITNYSLTTFDPVECEFIQVQDRDNYLNGQTY